MRWLIRHEIGCLLELIRVHRELELVGFVLRLVARDELERAWCKRHILGAHAEEAADADDVGFDLAVLADARGLLVFRGIFACEIGDFAN